jgi:hypothetical protein
MAPKTTSGPGRAQRKGRSEGRATAKAAAPTGGVGRYTPPEQSGRYTRPIPKEIRRSARWFGPSMLFLMIFGVLMILLNYLTVLPGSVSIWYLVAGLVVIFVAFMMATRYH